MPYDSDIIVIGCGNILFKDDENKAQDALNFYKKAVDICKDANENLYLSSCYSNISAIYEEQNQLKNKLFLNLFLLKIVFLVM